MISMAALALPPPAATAAAAATATMTAEMVLAMLAGEQLEPTETEQLVEQHSPEQLVELLGRPRHDIDAADTFGWTCLHHAAALGLTEHVEALVDAGAALGRQTTSESSYPGGLTPLGAASHTQEQGWGDREYICDVLRWAKEAEASLGLTGAAADGLGRAARRAVEWRARQTVEVAAAATKAQADKAASVHARIEQHAYR